MKQYNIADAKSHFSELVKLALLGEEVVIARDNKPLLRLSPIHRDQKNTAARFGQGANTVHLSRF